MNYPLILPSEEIALVIATIRSGDIRSKRADVAKAIWLIQGYAQNRAFGEPQSLAFRWPWQRAKELKDDEVAEYLSLLGQSPNAMLGIPWLLIFKWAAKLLLAIL